ncbi:MobA/MobL family protein [Qipengyuania flava]|uniref:MobA/MobL family protein n=1 Tax=Qipengyuania flava TaxID=192812 RepID=UPI00141A8053|nr:MobA/MobL family protein [Qipengyuania flava]NIJ61145.1 hypothetical protein [Qipengyuania flava]
MNTKTPTNRQLEVAAEFEAARIRIKLIREGILEDINQQSGLSMKPVRRGSPLLVKEGPRKEVPRFDIPATRIYRFATAAGVTSLHFAHRGIAKVTYAICHDGLRVKPGAARAHSNYIERDGGVAEFDARQVCSPEQNAQPYDVEGCRPAHSATTSGQDEYVRRTSAIAIQPDGNRALITSIDDDDVERSEFWSEVEKHERTASPDKMSFRVCDDQEFWLRVADVPECPAKLRQKIVGPLADNADKFVIENGKKTRAFLRDQEGWKGPGDGITAANDKSAMAKFSDGRGGRTQYRSEFSLPAELTPEQNFELLREFTREFERRRLPFVAVIHRPDEHNDPTNWHGHLVYYDRPCRRITQEDIERLGKRGFDVTGLTPGAWDFTVSVPTPGRPGRFSYPLRQNKVAVVSRSQDWPKTLRVRLAQVTNRHLEMVGIARRVSPETYKDMGIAADPQQHLGTNQSAAETIGQVTPLGRDNEKTQWEGIQNELQARMNLELAESLKRVATATPDLREALKAALDEATQLRRHILLLEQEIERGRSRAEMVVQRNERLLAADKDNDDDDADLVRNERAWLVQQGKRYLDELHGRTKNEQELLRRWRKEVGEKEQLADSIEKGEWPTIDSESDQRTSASDPMGTRTDVEVSDAAPTPTPAPPTPPDPSEKGTERKRPFPSGYPTDLGLER